MGAAMLLKYPAEIWLGYQFHNIFKISSTRPQILEYIYY